MHGEPVTIEGSELLARAIQHETDHLDGVLFIDRLDARGPQGGDEGRSASPSGSALDQPDGQGLPARAPTGWVC